MDRQTHMRRVAAAESERRQRREELSGQRRPVSPHVNIPLKLDCQLKTRSVAEKQAADGIMKKVGEWNEDEGRFYTLERQQQSRMQYFQHLHQALKFSPSDDYKRKQYTVLTDVKDESPKKQAKKGKRRAETPQPSTVEEEGEKSQEEEEPLPPRPSTATPIAANRRLPIRPSSRAVQSNRLHTANFDVSVIQAHQMTKKQLAEVRRTHPLLRNSPVLDAVNLPGTDPLAHLVDSKHTPQRGYDRSRLVNPEETILKPPATSPVSIDDLPERRPPPKPTPIPDLPKIPRGGADPQYSSLMVQLRRTRKAVLDHGRSLNTVKSLLDMQGSAELKKTITRIFADPKQASAISEGEWARRQRQYDAERQRLQEQQQEELRDQHEELERELGHLLVVPPTHQQVSGLG